MEETARDNEVILMVMVMVIVMVIVIMIMMIYRPPLRGNRDPSLPSPLRGLINQLSAMRPLGRPLGQVAAVRLGIGPRGLIPLVLRDPCFKGPPLAGL